MRHWTEITHFLYLTFIQNHARMTPTDFYKDV